MTDDHEAALLAAVQADPEDYQARAIYADWLEERGDPRGEYLRLDMQLVTLPARLTELVERIDPDWIRAVSGRFRVMVTAVGSQKILAIKLVRELTGLGLKDAKDLVESVTPAHPVLLANDLELDVARSIVAKCRDAMTLAIEPRLSPTTPRSPSGPAGSRLGYRVTLVGVTDRLELIRELQRRLVGRSIVEVRTLVDQVAAGGTFEIAVRLDATAAAELAVAIGMLGTVRLGYA